MIKNFAKKVVTSLIFNYSRLYYKIYYRNSYKDNAIVLAPSWEGSKGDEAVIFASSAYIKDNKGTVTLIHLGEKEWRHVDSVTNFYSISTYFKSGGWMEHIRMIKLFSKHSKFYLLGTDMLDGSYGDFISLGLLKIARHAAVTGLSTNIVSISVNTWQHPDCLEAIAKLPKKVKVCIRDILAYNRLKSKIPNREFYLTTDVAFILKPKSKSEESKKIIQWVQGEKAKGRLIIGVNLNPLSFDEKDMDERLNTVVKDLAKFDQEQQSNISYLYIPHDFRKKRNDLSILQDLYKKLPEAIQSRTLVVENNLSSEELKGIAGQVDFGIVSRMHLAVAVLSQGIPAIAVIYQPAKTGFSNYSESVLSQIYQDKFDGLYRHFDQTEKTFEPDKFQTEGAFYDFLTANFQHLKELKSKVEAALPKVKNMAVDNMVGL